MFAVPTIVYVFMMILTGQSFIITWEQLLMLIGISIFFSYLGNVLSLKSIEYAPNPGYSLILSKSYVVFTSIAAVFLFDSPLSFKSIIAILMIIVFSALIMIQQTKSENKKFHTSWLILSIGAFFCWGMLSLASKYINELGVITLQRVFYVSAIVSMIILIEMKAKRVSIKGMNKDQLVILLLIGLVSAAFNFFMQSALATSPNLGFVNAINASSIAVVSLFSALLFNDELTKRKLIGIIGATIGLILLVM